MSVLARSSSQELEKAFLALADQPEVRILRQAETGLVMVRGRAGGDGQRFNLGEVTVTRAAVMIDGRTGHGYIKGRDRRHAELAAIFDALLQDENRKSELINTVVDPLARVEQDRRALVQSKAAATKVDFFTMVRGS